MYLLSSAPSMPTQEVPFRQKHDLGTSSAYQVMYAMYGLPWALAHVQYNTTMYRNKRIINMLRFNENGTYI